MDYFSLAFFVPSSSPSSSLLLFYARNFVCKYICWDFLFVMYLHFVGFVCWSHIAIIRNDKSFNKILIHHCHWTVFLNISLFIFRVQFSLFCSRSLSRSSLYTSVFQLNEISREVLQIDSIALNWCRICLSESFHRENWLLTFGLEF